MYRPLQFSIRAWAGATAASASTRSQAVSLPIAALLPPGHIKGVRDRAHGAVTTGVRTEIHQFVRSNPTCPIDSPATITASSGLV